MNEFKICSKIEQDGEKMFFNPFKQYLENNGGSIIHHSTREEQRNGDYTVLIPGKSPYQIDRKHETRSSPNMFFEIYSNYKPGTSYHRYGWGVNSNYRYCVYSFGNNYIYPFIHMDKLKSFLGISNIENNIIYDNGLPKKYFVNGKTYRICAQEKHKQKNLTVGILVPFSDIQTCVVKTGMTENGIFKECSFKDFLDTLRYRR